MNSARPFPSDVADKFLLRLPDGMRERIAEAAKANGRSMNAEIAARLEESFGKTHGPDWAEAFERLLLEMQQIKQLNKELLQASTAAKSRAKP